MSTKPEFDSSLTLFVAGLPSKATPEELKLFFANFGEVRLLRLRTSRKGSRFSESNPQNNIRRGFCVVEAFDQNTYFKIQEFSGGIFKGRKITITKIREHEEFLADSVDLNQRKIILTEVPKFLSPKFMTEMLSIKFGEVKKISTIKTLKAETHLSSLYYKIYLIEFLHQNGAINAIKSENFSFLLNDRILNLNVLSYEKRREEFIERKQVDFCSDYLLTTEQLELNFNEKIQKNESTKFNNHYCNDQLKEVPESTYLKYFDLVKPTSLRYHYLRRFSKNHTAHNDIGHSQFHLRINILRK